MQRDIEGGKYCLTGVWNLAKPCQPSYTEAMTLSEIRRKASPILERYEVQYAGVFGSVARSEDTPESDVDVLVDLKQPVSLLKFFALNDELETALGCRVDLVTRNSLNPHVKPFALKELQTVYEEVR